MSANSRQVGGSHYSSQYQHWDWCIAIGLHYLLSAATKYLCRWRNKNGLQDVEKAGHYLDKYIEVLPIGIRDRSTLSRQFIAAETQRWLDTNNITGSERVACWTMATWNDRDDLIRAREAINAIIETYRNDESELMHKHHQENFKEAVYQARQRYIADGDESIHAKE